MTTRQQNKIKSFEDWKSAASQHARNMGVAGDDIWDPGDPYDLGTSAKDSYDAQWSPEEFIETSFAEDLAAMTADSLMAEEGDFYLESC